MLKKRKLNKKYKVGLPEMIRYFKKKKSPTTQAFV